MPAELVEFDRARINELLDLLDDRLRARGVAASVYLVGGAAIAMTLPDRRVTADIDALASHRAVMEEAVAIAEAETLPPHWLNENAAGWIPPRGQLPASDSPGLAVQVAPPRHLLAMKMVAFRTRDVDDMVALARLLDMAQASAEDFARLLADVYDGEDQLQQMLAVPYDDVEEEALRRGEAVVRVLLDSAASGFHRGGPATS